jgi:3-oxoadipate enol-lactonase
VRTGVAHLPHRSVRYLEAGRGRPVVLLHAFPLSAEQWLPQLHRPPAGRRLVAPDLRGFRGVGTAFEDAGLENLSIDDYAADVLALMAHLDLERPVVTGLSMGGYVALALIGQAPARVGGLVLASTRAGADSADGRAGRDRMLGLLEHDGPAGVARELVPRLLGATTRREQPDLALAVARVIQANSSEALAAAVAAMRDRPDRSPMLSSIACPSWVVWGEEDAIVARADAEVLHRGIAASTLMVLPRAGHLSNLEAPREFSDLLGRLSAGL